MFKKKFKRRAIYFDCVMRETPGSWMIQVDCGERILFVPKSVCHWGAGDNLFVDYWYIREKKLSTKSLLRRPAHIEPEYNQEAISELLDNDV